MKKGDPEKETQNFWRAAAAGRHTMCKVTNPGPRRTPTIYRAVSPSVGAPVLRLSVGSAGAPPLWRPRASYYIGFLLLPFGAFLGGVRGQLPAGAPRDPSREAIFKGKTLFQEGTVHFTRVPSVLPKWTVPPRGTVRFTLFQTVPPGVKWTVPPRGTVHFGKTDGTLVKRTVPW